jgi:hypothetical protein
MLLEGELVSCDVTGPVNPPKVEPRMFSVHGTYGPNFAGMKN